ncbi:hypothetical protein JYB64_18870 [Algoriphagus aestuarii]|nr:hypothetical protein [Algoriphagus aestuarii]
MMINFRNITFLVASFSFLISCENKKDSQNPELPAQTETELADGNFPYRNLSTYGFFGGEIKKLRPNPSLIPYQPASSLFTDYALKSRFIQLPEKEQASIEYDSLLLPKGTILIKNFYYPADLSIPEENIRIIETRLLIHGETGWEAFPYIWNDDQNEAVLKVVGGEKEVKFKNLQGEDQVVNYLIPNKNQCKTCHNQSEQLAPIGIKIKHLNNDFDFTNGRQNQLAYWTEKGRLKGFLGKEHHPHLINYEDTSQALADRAMAYLDINCSHCHQANGPASTSGLFLEYDQVEPLKLGIMKTPVAAGNGAGAFDYDIVPGKADESILTYRMNSTEVGIAMPELGRTIVHQEGVALIKKWINSLEK